jgi:predicted Fe-Mo cluster-binding NifX family protein
MFLCIPIEDDNGLASRVCAHFGSTPAFMIVDTEQGTTRTIPNLNQHHGHGMCAPLASLSGERIDGMVVGGMGMGALQKLMAAGVKVWRAEHETVGETVAAMKAGSLKLMQPGMTCAGHDHDHGHGHS